MLALTIALGLAAPAFAQSSQTAPSTVPAAPGADQPAVENTVIVTGQRGAAARARAEERISDTLVNVVSSDDVGQFGDQNTAEALQRLPGVNIDRNEGEGRTVSVRGLPSAFTQVSVNGVRVGTSEAGDSSVALDVIPSDQLGSLTIAKTYTPDMDGDTIGGAINLRSLSAFSSSREQTTLRLEGSYQDEAGDWSPKAAFSMTRRLFGGDLGVALALNYQDRKVEGDDLRNDEETGILTAVRGGQTFYYPLEADARREVGQRERFGGTLNLEYRPNDSSEYFLRLQYNELTDDDIRIQYLIELDRSSGAEILDLSNSSLDFIDVRVRAQTFFQPTTDRLSVISAGARYTRDNGGEFSWQADFSRSNWIQENGVRGRFQIDDVRARVSWDASSVRLLPLEVEPARPPGAARDQRDPRLPTAYTFSNLLFIEEERIDDIGTVQFNYRHPVSVAGREGFVQFGLKFRDREKSADKIEFNGTPSTAGINRSFANTETFVPQTGIVGFGAFPTLQASRELYLSTRDALLAQPGFNRRDQSTASDYVINERVSAVYVMAGADISDTMKLIGGLRIESTVFSADGFLLESNTDGLSATGGLPLVATLPTVSRTYTNALPSLTLRWEPSETMVVRASYGRGIKRPDFDESRNRIEIRFDGTGAGTAASRRMTAGNPNLRAMVADQFDVSVAWYPSRNTSLQVALFHKDIEDFIIEVATNRIEDIGLVLPAGILASFPFGISSSINGGDAFVTGVELSFAHNFVALPGLLSGLFVEGNVTLANSEATVSLRPGETFAFPGQADLTANLSVGWENETFSLRLAGTHTGERLQGLAAANRRFEDRYRAAYTQIDVNVRWNINDRFQLYADGINLNEAQEERFYVGPGTGGVYERIQSFGASYQVGVRILF